MPLRLSRRSKYGNRKTVVDGTRFDSTAEARRHQELRILVKVGEISGFINQPQFPLIVNGVLVATYVGDFEVTRPDGEVVIEDVKGFKTPTYRLKARLFHAIYGFAITEVR